MRRALCTLSILAVPLAILDGAAAHAATIAEGTSNHGAEEFYAFDGSLGTLNSVTFYVDTTEYRQLYETYPQTPENFSWAVAGDLSVLVLNRDGTGAASVDVPLTGSGSVTDSVYSEITLTGAVSVSLDPAMFIGGPKTLIEVFASDPGMFYASDIRITSDRNNVKQVLGCDWGVGAEEECEFNDYSVAYNYTPFRGVPEPATWGMMLLGFGAIGFATLRAKGRTWRFRAAAS